MITDEIIKEKLDRKESRELLLLIRTNATPFLHFKLDGIEEFYQDLKTKSKSIENYHSSYYKGWVFSLLRIQELYLKVTDDFKSCVAHWYKSHQEQVELHQSYNRVAKPPRQDNKTYINYGSRNSNRNKIRRPKKNRKTAWKRFRKLFPDLKD